MRNIELILIDFDHKETHHFQDVTLAQIAKIFMNVQFNRKLIKNIKEEKMHGKTKKNTGTTSS